VAVTVRRGERFVVGALCAILCYAAASGAGAATRPTAARTVHVVFTGAGGGRYLDVLRWLHDDTRECYARQTEDQMVHVAWRIVFSVRVAGRPGSYDVVAANRRSGSIAGSVDGKSVRDSCDAAEDEPGWSGTTACEGSLPIRSHGSADVGAKGRVELIGPSFDSLDKTACGTEIRNDQLRTHVDFRAAVSRALQADRAITIRVGTTHPGPGDAYLPTKLCSLFPHIYDGIVYLYDCQDTLTWNGTVSIAPA
jgi:hypothetical protein